MRRHLIISAIALCLSYNNVIAKDITIDARSVPATDLFEEIMAQSGKNFIYPASLLDGMRISLKADNEPLKSVLDRMFKGTDISYKSRGRNIILYKTKDNPPIHFTVSGFVREHGTGESVIGAIVTDTVSNTSTATNPSGFFSLRLPSKTASLIITYPGYHDYRSGKIDLTGNSSFDINLLPSGHLLSEVVVTESKNRNLSMESARIGGLSLSRDNITDTPVLFGESDVVKTIQLEPGVSAGIEGMAGMYVHGGGPDENLYMLDNIPLYQINHFGGLFSAFNTEAIKNVDFYKSTFPARYDGRLSSFMDVHTRDGSLESHHGLLKLGLTSGALSINGPVRKGTTSYSLDVRRSWYDILTIPVFAIYNKVSDSGSEQSMRYSFIDINAKINHHFSRKSSAYVMFYYGNDFFKIKEKTRPTYDSWYSDKENSLNWGNIVASLGWNYLIAPNLHSSVTAAYTHYGSRLKHYEKDGESKSENSSTFTSNNLKSINSINDWIIRADFDYRPSADHSVTFGAYYTRHSFLPSRSTSELRTESLVTEIADSSAHYDADELNLYIGDDWKTSDRVRLNAGIHYSFFRIDGNTMSGLSPTISFRYIPADRWAVKVGYSRTVQYVHQLSQSAISLPTDQWIPIVGQKKPSSADNIALACYYSVNNTYIFSVEGYMKWMHNLIDYKDEYYLVSPDVAWDNRLTSGKGTAKGIDFKFTKEAGRFTGHLSYSLLWSDRVFAEKNKGRKYPSRFDNRHKINILVNWKLSDKWDINASWTGMSGNRITLPLQCWEDPMLAPWHYDMMLFDKLNNYRLPFYHRLDLSFTRHTRNGFWNFSFYNAYCNMNVIAVRLDYSNYYEPSRPNYLKPVFQKIRLLPIIPSVSYTWKF